jgi:Spy/CpxP family protein refolding chaperone
MSRHGLSGHGGMSGHLLHHLLRHKQELGLTDDQVAKLRTLSLDQDRARIRAHADMLVAKRELRALAWDDSAELSAIEAKIKESEALEATLKFMAVKGRRELKGVLTPEQRAKLKAWWEQRQHEPGARPMRAEAEESGEREELAEGTTGLTEIELSETGDGQPVS